MRKTALIAMLVAAGTILVPVSTASAYVNYAANGGGTPAPAPAGAYTGKVVMDSQGSSKLWRIYTESGQLVISDDDPSLSQAEKDALQVAAGQNDSDNIVNVGPGAGQVDRVRTGPTP